MILLTATFFCMALCSLGCGLWCLKNPRAVIRFQQYFYSKINWRIEPINLDKEIRNTRNMGGLLIFLAIAIFLLIANGFLKPFDFSECFR